MKAMAHFLFFSLVFVMMTVTGWSQSTERLHQVIKDAPPDSNKVNSILNLAKFYLDKPGDEKSDMDSSSRYAEMAIQESRKIRRPDLIIRAWDLQGQILIAEKKYNIAEQRFDAIARHYEQKGDLKKAADTWLAFGEELPNFIPEIVKYRRVAFGKAYPVYQKLGLRQNAADVLGKIADADIYLKNLKLAEKEIQEVIKEYYELKYPKIYLAYFLLAEILYQQDEIQKSLIARIECINYYEQDASANIYDGIRYYYALGGAYYNDGQFKKSLTSYLKCLSLSDKANSQEHFYYAIRGCGLCYAKLKMPSDGLNLLKRYANRFPSKVPVEQQLLMSTELELHAITKNNKRIEQIIPVYLKSSNEVLKGLKTDIDVYNVSNFIALHDPLMKYYIRTKQWDRLIFNFQILNALPKNNLSVLIRRRMLNYEFCIDSVQGNALIALGKLRKVNAITDSINNANISRQIHELETKYRTLAKDKTIQELKSRSAIQQSKLEQQKTQLISAVVVVLLLASISVVIYLNYQHKKKANFELSSKQEYINDQNVRLSGLLLEKDRLILDKDELLTEKEWLVREVHHRVKNNLQMILSLLYNQGTNLKTKESKLAIKNIQDQIQSIAIIHQKLYNKSGMTVVTLSEYIGDLINYLSSVYSANLRRVRFRLELDNISLEPVQLVPLGLIINEAITNTIKYAFDNMGGEIVIKAFKTRDHKVRLSISDTGKGFDDVFAGSSSSLGVEMMEALAKQINGTFKRMNHNGAVIIIEFAIINPKPIVATINHFLPN